MPEHRTFLFAFPVIFILLLTSTAQAEEQKLTYRLKL